jgi:hypothetical protein
MRIAHHLSTHQLVIERDLVEYSKYAPPTLPFVDEQASKTQMTLVMRDVIVHWWTNCRSCFKMTARTPKGSVCRFFMPNELQEA